MTDIAGLVISIASSWKTCVEIFDIIDSSKYEMGYETLRVKLEVERIRLLAWGGAVGLSKVENCRQSPDPRLNRSEVRGVVLRLLGCIYLVFKDTEKFQERYGLRPVTLSIPDHAGSAGPSAQPEPMLGSVFKQPYEILRRSARNRQCGTPLGKKTVWAIHDKKKFQAMVSEIKGFNDNLESLFPDMKMYTSKTIAGEVAKSQDIDALQSLQEATAGEHQYISETASVRLEAIEAMFSARSRIHDDEQTLIGDTIITPQPGWVNANADAENDSSEELDEVSKQMEMLEIYASKKSDGALMLSLLGPYDFSASVTAYVRWEGRQSDDTWSHWDDKDRGFVKSSHASFDLYHRKRYIKGSRRRSLQTDESHILFDVESNPKYENVNPGTITVEGLGIECWDYEEKFGKERKNTIFISYADLPKVPAKKLLRRIDELRRGVNKFGWNPDQEEADLKAFFGNIGPTYSVGSRRMNDSLRIADFYSALNRRDVFADFTSKSSIAMEWGGPKEESIGIWNFLWQIILAKELALRLEHLSEDVSVSGFTHRVLASLIIQDLWLRNVEIVLTDIKIALEATIPATPEERDRAKSFNLRGNEAMKKGQWQVAVDFYTEAIKIELDNAGFRSNRSAAFRSMERHEDAREDAFIATRLDPNHALSWARLGQAERKLGNGKRARSAFERAIDIAGKDASNMMKQGLADAKAKIEADIQAINKETNKAVKDVLRKNYLDEDWDDAFKTAELHSRVHEQQVEGLLLFAERMRWPYINEVRDYAEDVYSNLRSGHVTISPFLHDWLYGMMLPGKWMSFKIMAALVLCTPSISASLQVAAYYDSGLSLPKRSYWRVRTVLGRVLGCLPGVVSLCGWIGPCPPVEFVPPLSEEAKKKPRYINLKARHVAPIEHTPNSDDGVMDFSPRHDRYKAVRMQPDEDLPTYISEMKDADRWVIPEPPVRELSTCTIQSIRLEKLASNLGATTQRNSGEPGDKEKTEYRASIIFSMDNNEDLVKYKLLTNPVFVTLPPCRPGPKGPHEVHLREFPIYQKNIWTVDRLKDHMPEDVDDDVMVINATGKGTEVLARAWCSERGKNAVIRYADGPCFVCAVRAASKAGLNTGILIWVS
ncbi:hypothetical protein AX17_006494 [Amanita inopinata Kibby_2008]|nr:hypothetical protein AX17_006494 [Amanita inopinata Kibby_2008]